MEGRHLIYFADPMCSWCWGFAPTLAAVRARFGEALPVRLVLGGLRPGTDQPLTDKARAELAHHWDEVAKASGQGFDTALIDRPEGFVYDTDPAARACVVVRRMAGMEAALDYLEAAQRAFYAQARDVTDPAVLADLAAPFGLAPEVFAVAHGSEPLKHETWADYGISQRAGVTGFPTLVAGPGEGGVFGVVTRGWAAPGPVVQALDDWLRRTAA